uniref:Lysophospholipid acyltransferase 7 n=1 Tax=Schistocephalus solidus TaxID=70667 RepID=A0A183T3V7_SCHSO
LRADETFEKATVLQSTTALVILRATSVGLEFANKLSSLPRTVIVSQLTLLGLLEAVCYATYPPTFCFGPLVSFSDWCLWRKRTLQVEISASIEITPGFKGSLTPRPLCARSLGLRAARLLLWFFVWEATLHIVYPNVVLFLATQPAADVSPPPSVVGSSVPGRFHASPYLETDRAALGGAVYLIGLQFFFAYMQLYGWPGLLSDVQVYLLARRRSSVASPVFNCLVPDGPPCPTHVFLFSEMWRRFDRGLYNFLKWYIYLPWLKPKEPAVRKKSVSPATLPYHPVSLVQRLQGGLLCFLFVLVFHSCNWQNVYRVIAIICYYCTYQISVAAKQWHNLK